MLLVDIASYQGALATADVVRDGFQAVNLKVSHGLSRKSVHPDVAGWVDRARAAGLGICTFHYMTADAAGEAQAEYAYQQIISLGLTYGTAHQLDVEADSITEGAVRAYLARMSLLLGRPVALYTGDWYWQPRGWNVADLTPYLWAAPNSGYLSAYPGDSAPTWAAGYGGWPTLAVMQYAVSPLGLPGATIRVSKSAIRDPEVWRSFTQGRSGMSYAPAPLIAARKFYIDTLKQAGYTIDPLSVGIIGDDSHANSGTSYHLGKDALRSDAYSIVESSRDRNGLTNAAAALDLGKFRITVGGKVYDLPHLSLWLVAQCKAGAADVADIREVIYSPDGTTVKRWDRLGKRTTGDSSHTEHTHESWFRDSENRDKMAHLRRYFTEIGVIDVAIDGADLKAIWQTDGLVNTPSNATDRDTNSFRTPAEALTNIEYHTRNVAALLASYASAEAARDAGVSETLKALMNLVVQGGGDIDSAAVLAKLDEVKATIVSAASAAGADARDKVLAQLKAEASAAAAAFGGGA